jgi:hypothetical protein
LALRVKRLNAFFVHYFSSARSCLLSRVSSFAESPSNHAPLVVGNVVGGAQVGGHVVDAVDLFPGTASEVCAGAGFDPLCLM